MYRAWVRWPEHGTDPIWAVSTACRIMACEERKRGGRSKVWVGMWFEWAFRTQLGQGGRVLVIGSRRNAEHKSDVKKEGASCAPFNYAARRLFFWDIYPRKSEASRPIAPVKLWLPQSSVFRVRLTSEYVFNYESPPVLNIGAPAHV